MAVDDFYEDADEIHENVLINDSGPITSVFFSALITRDPVILGAALDGDGNLDVICGVGTGSLIFEYTLVGDLNTDTAIVTATCID